MAKCPFKRLYNLFQIIMWVFLGITMPYFDGFVYSFKVCPVSGIAMGALMKSRHDHDEMSTSSLSSVSRPFGINRIMASTVDSAHLKGSSAFFHEPIFEAPPYRTVTPPPLPPIKIKKRDEPLQIVNIGLSHHTAAVDIREKLAVPESEWNAVSSMLVEKYDSISEAFILSTCNRFEIYAAGVEPYQCMKDILSFLTERTSAHSNSPVDQTALRNSLYMLTGDDAVQHLLHVSAGLDSLVLGENQILGQVKKAYDCSRNVTGGGQGGQILSRMLNTAVAAGKRVRCETGICRGAVSISAAAVEFVIMKMYEDLGFKSLAMANLGIVGSGKMARLLLVHLQSKDVSRVTIVCRNPEKVRELQQEFPSMQLTHRPMADLQSVMDRADVMVTCTSSPTPIIAAPQVQRALSSRKALFSNGQLDYVPKIQLVDISVPRNVDANCNGMADTSGVVSSYNVDDLKAVVQANTNKRQHEIKEAEGILQDELEKFTSWKDSLSAVPTLQKLQAKFERLREEEVNKMQKKFSDNLTTKDMDVVTKLSKGIVSRLLNGPTSHLMHQQQPAHSPSTMAGSRSSSSQQTIQAIQQAFQLDASCSTTACSL